MANVTVIGGQWGDEGKGKIVDWLASRADVVVRFQGGHNAGHTLVVGDSTYKLSLLPSGIVRGTLSVLGNGVVLDPWALRDEVAKLTEQGIAITPDNFQIAETCPLILPFHRDLDALREDASGPSRDAVSLVQESTTTSPKFASLRKGLPPASIKNKCSGHKLPCQRRSGCAFANTPAAWWSTAWMSEMASGPESKRWLRFLPSKSSVTMKGTPPLALPCSRICRRCGSAILAAWRA